MHQMQKTDYNSTEMLEVSLKVFSSGFQRFQTLRIFRKKLCVEHLPSFQRSAKKFSNLGILEEKTLRSAIMIFSGRNQILIFLFYSQSFKYFAGFSKKTVKFQSRI